MAVSDGAVTMPVVHGWYLSLNQPPGTPPNWVFGPVWTLLYLLIAVAAWRVWLAIGDRGAVGRRPLRLWGWQLLANAAWSPAFFGLHSPRLGMIVMVVLLVLIGRTIAVFRGIDRPAASLMLPYALWTCYAAYLNAGFLWLNPA